MTPSITIERIPAPNAAWHPFDQTVNRGTRGTPRFYQEAGKPVQIHITQASPEAA